MRILIIQQKMIGDVLISTLLCKNLKLWNPKVHIDFVANTHTLEVIQNNPYIDEVVVFDDGFKTDKWGLFRFLLQQQKKNYDYIIDAYGKLESQLICLFTPAKTKIGYKKTFTSLLYDFPIKRKQLQEDKLQLSIKNRFQLLEPIMGNFPKNRDVEICLTAEEIAATRQKFDRELGLGKQAIMVAAMGSSPEKTYPLDQMAQLLNATFQTTKLNLILNYRPDQGNAVDTLIQLLNADTQKAIVKSLTPHSLRDFIATTHHCLAVVGNEGGAINIAKGLNKPTFAIFSPIIDPAGWHTEIHNKNMAVHLHSFFPEKIDFKNHRKLQKNPHKIKTLYREFKPELFEDRWIGFLKNAIGQPAKK